MPVTITDATTEFVTLEEVKRHANITSGKDDDELRMILGAAQEHVESLIGPVLHRTVVESVGAIYGSVALGTMPVLSVTSVTSSGTPVIGYTLDALTGIISGVSGGTVVVTYAAGRTSCPDAVRLATLIIAAHMWSTQLGSTPSAAPLDDLQDTGSAFGSGFALPRRAEQLLAPYMRVAGIA